MKVIIEIRSTRDLFLGYVWVTSSLFSLTMEKTRWKAQEARKVEETCFILWSRFANSLVKYWFHLKHEPFRTIKKRLLQKFLQVCTFLHLLVSKFLKRSSLWPWVSFLLRSLQAVTRYLTFMNLNFHIKSFSHEKRETCSAAGSEAITKARETFRSCRSFISNCLFLSE